VEHGVRVNSGVTFFYQVTQCPSLAGRADDLDDNSGGKRELVDDAAI